MGGPGVLAEMTLDRCANTEQRGQHVQSSCDRRAQGEHRASGAGMPR